MDPRELKRIAINIAHNAVPPTENAEIATRLNISAAAIDSDNTDPLGCGRIDTRLLALVRLEESLGAASPGRL